MKKLFVFFIILCILSQSALAAFVNDSANVLSVSQEQKISQVLRSWHDEGVAEARVVLYDVTVNSEGLSTEGLAKNLYTLYLSDLDRKNGIVLLINTADNSYSMIAGSGLKSFLSDEWIDEETSKLLVPSMIIGDYGSGVFSLVASTNNRLRPLGDNMPKLTAVPPTDKLTVYFIIGMSMISILLYFLYVWWSNSLEDDDALQVR